MSSFTGCVSTHVLKPQPIANIKLRKINFFAQKVNAITSWAKDSASLCLWVGLMKNQSLRSHFGIVENGTGEGTVNAIIDIVKKIKRSISSRCCCSSSIFRRRRRRRRRRGRRRGSINFASCKNMNSQGHALSCQKNDQFRQ